MNNKTWILAVLLLPAAVSAQNLGVGVRLGDPSGLTLKKYMDGKALEISVGRTHWFHRSGWYNNRFSDWYYDQKFGYDEFQYLSARAPVPVGIQVHWLIGKDIAKVGDADTPGLQWYYGFGGQVRFRSYYYDYRYKYKGDPIWYYERDHRVTELDLGLDGVIGLEYTFESVPFSLFLDFTLFMELADDPFLFWGQGGLGLRYNF